MTPCREMIVRGQSLRVGHLVIECEANRILKPLDPRGRFDFVGHVQARELGVDPGPHALAAGLQAFARGCCIQSGRWRGRRQGRS